MFFVETLTQALVYLCFAILTGSFILHLIPDTNRPEIKGGLMLASAGIAIFSFIPVLRLILYLSSGIGFWQTMNAVLFSFEVGKTWTFTFIVSSILYIFVIWFNFQKKPLYSCIGLALTFLLILTLGLSSHASSLDPIRGFLSHTLHLTAVSIWVGILLIVSWFSTNEANWQKFLKWFTPVALVCLGVVILTGLALISFVMELNAYPDSWIIPYGQSLLVKHLLLLPLLVFAVINGVLVKRKWKSKKPFPPKPWARMESVVILHIFSATAALGQQSPPHETIATSAEASKLFTSFYQGSFQPDMSILLTLNPTGIILFVLAIVFISIMIQSFLKETPPITAFLMGILSVFCMYFALMFSIL